MRYQQLAERIDERLKAMGLSERKACLRAGLKVDAIRSIRTRSHAPRTETLVALARVLDVPASYFLDAVAATAVEGPRKTISLSPVYVRGHVQAGEWREAIEWDGSDWYAITVPTDGRFPGIERFALEVRGDSMDKEYPEGSMVVCVRLGDIGRPPENDEDVVIIRRSREGLHEATLKRFHKTGRRYWLMPQSSNPEHQPIAIDTPAPAAEHPAGSQVIVHASSLPDDGAAADISLWALVVGVFRYR